jgi:hypothetical protein
MAKISKVDPAKRLRGALDDTLGRLTYGDGRRVYGHRRLQKQRCEVMHEILRHEISGTASAPQNSAALTIISASERTSLPSAALAGRMGRAACVAVAVAAVVAVLVFGMKPMSTEWLSISSAGAVSLGEGLGIL